MIVDRGCEIDGSTPRKGRRMMKTQASESTARRGLAFRDTGRLLGSVAFLVSAAGTWAADDAGARFRAARKPEPIRIDHVRRADGPAAGQSTVTFDLAWDHSWRAAWAVAPEWHGGTGTLKLESWDAAWVFVKSRKAGAERYSHATLSTNVADHTVPAGAKLDVGASQDGKRGLGAFVYRATPGDGANDWKGVTLRWLHQADGVDDPGAADLRVFALRMVYVPQCAFWAGDGTVNATTGPFSLNDMTNLKGQNNGHIHLVTGQFSAGDTAEPFRIETEEALTLGGESKKNLGNREGLGMLRTDDFTSFVTRTLPARFPKGYAAFYCMKHEVTRGEYAAFLTTLSLEQQGRLTARGNPACKGPDSPAGTLVYAPDDPQGIRIAAPGKNPATPAVYGTDAPRLACNYLSWTEGLQYANWAGLRLMTELEYEKACRGPLKPVPNEYAWGTDRIPAANAPVPDGDRVTARASYWGILGLSDNMGERTVTVGNAFGRRFVGTHGDGTLAKPARTQELRDGHRGGSRCAGGCMSKMYQMYENLRLRTSDRYWATSEHPSLLAHPRQQYFTSGFRFVRTAAAH
jgi:formylglycine-generating enzyme required for sulfatase activity